jgi:hypothetical protein
MPVLFVGEFEDSLYLLANYSASLHVEPHCALNGTDPHCSDTHRSEWLRNFQKSLRKMVFSLAARALRDQTNSANTESDLSRWGCLRCGDQPPNRGHLRTFVKLNDASLNPHSESFSSGVEIGIHRVVPHLHIEIHEDVSTGGTISNL